MTGTGTTTGSWAESTHSVIWLTRGGNRLPLARVGRRSWGTNLISVAVIALTSLIAASNLLDVYGSAAMWAVAAVPATLLGALIAYAGTAPALRLWWQIVFLIVAQGVIGPVIALNDTAISHVIPSVETLSQGFVSTFGAFKYLIAVPPPTGSGDGSLMAAWTICLWLSFLAGVFAIGDKRQLSVLSLLPIAIDWWSAPCWHADRFPAHSLRRSHRPHHDRLAVMAMATSGTGTLDQRHDHPAAGGRPGRGRMHGHRAVTSDPARLLRSAAQPVRLRKPAQRPALLRQGPQG